MLAVLLVLPLLLPGVQPRWVPAPRFSLSPGIYQTPQVLSITCRDPQAAIYYTTDGSEPTRASLCYTAPLTLDRTLTIRARAFTESNDPGKISSAKYSTEDDSSVQTPVYDPPGGTYESGPLRVWISSATPSAEVRYTLDGSEPTLEYCHSALPITVTGTTLIKATAFLNKMAPSRMARAVYQIGIGPDGMVLVQGGTFHTGAANVTLSSFSIGRCEVSQSSYKSIMGALPPGCVELENGPVNGVTWFNAVEYCNRRSIAEGLKPCYRYLSSGTDPAGWPSGWSGYYQNAANIGCDWHADGYRLPTEMEWMFAASGGTRGQGFVYSGSDSLDEVGWYKDNSGNVFHPMGTRQPNELGLYDMSGNLREWCWDIYQQGYPTGDEWDPRGPEKGYSDRVIRGGSYDYDATFSEVDHRAWYMASTGLGFRVCRGF